MKPMKQQEFEGLLRSNLRLSLSDQGGLKCSRFKLFRIGDCSKYEETKTKTCFFCGHLLQFSFGAQTSTKDGII